MISGRQPVSFQTKEERHAIKRLSQKSEFSKSWFKSGGNYQFLPSKIKILSIPILAASYEEFRVLTLQDGF